MIVKFGVSVVGARGTAGGITFSANKAGPYAKLWSRGSNPSTSTQSAQRGVFGEFASGWAALSSAQRADWDDYADDPAQELFNSLGVSYYASGFNWYVSVNSNLREAGAAARTAAPTLTRPLAPIIQLVLMRVGGTASGSVIRFTVADPDLTALHLGHCLLWNSTGPTHIPQKMPFIQLAVPNVNRDIFIKDPVEDRFGDVVVGQRLLARTWIQDSHGQRGPSDTDWIDVTP